jgi:hypothetical protein
MKNSVRWCDVLRTLSVEKRITFREGCKVPSRALAGTAKINTGVQDADYKIKLDTAGNVTNPRFGK